MSFEVLGENDKNMEIAFEQLERELNNVRENYRAKRQKILETLENDQKNDAIALSEVTQALAKLSKLSPEENRKSKI